MAGDDEFNEILRKAEQGDSQAQFNLGVMYYDGRDVEQSYEIAAEWFRKSAEQGNSAAPYNLALMYDEGRGVEQSDERHCTGMEKPPVRAMKMR